MPVRVLCLVILTLTASSSASAQGILESATGSAMRAPVDGRSLPSTRGRFTFPSPYNTEGVRLTTAADCGGADCVQPVGYSYWSNINNHVGSDTMLIFLGLKGQGATLFSYNKSTGETRNLGSVFGSNATHSWAKLASGEGWYFSGTRPSALYINEPMGSRLFRFDVVAKTWETVFDMSSRFPNKYLWQVHSSQDDRVHSFTVRDKGSYAMEGCAIYREDQRTFVYYARRGSDFDECQIDKSGRWLVIKEQLDGVNGEDNRVIDVAANTERVLNDPDGAAGHSDMGSGYLVAEDNFNAQPGAVRVWNFGLDLRGGQPLSPVAGQGTLVYQMASWGPGLGHVAHGNSKVGVAPGQQVACASNANRTNTPRVNEIVCFRLDGSLQVLVVAPNLTDLNASGGGSDDYWKFPKGNLDVTGEYFIWTTNAGSGRLDAFMVKVPLNRLGASTSGSPTPTSPVPAPAPAPTPTPAPAPAPQPTVGGVPVSWTNVVNAQTNGSSLMKSGGCSGCQDSGAASAQTIDSGDGFVEFTVSEATTLRFVGLTTRNTTTASKGIRYALRLQSGYLEVRESGAYRSSTRFAAGDLLRVAYVGGQVQYSKNGTVFYTSASAPVYPAVVDTTLYDAQAGVMNVTIGSATATSAPAPAPAPAGDAVPVNWTSLVNATAVGGTLTKSGGCSGCPDAGAVSMQVIPGNGHVELPAAGSGLRYIGLTTGSMGTGADEIKFALRLQAGFAEVRENGIYRADVPVIDTDMLRIAIVDGRVEYSKNGLVFFTSPVPASYPAQVDTSLFDAQATLPNVVISGAQ